LPADGKRHWSKTSCRPALRSPVAVVFFLTVLGAGLAGDLLSKHYVFQTMLNDPAVAERLEELQLTGVGNLTGRQMLHRLTVSRRVLRGVRFSLSTNPGVVFGLYLPRWVVAAASAVTVALVLFFFATAAASARSAHLGLALIVAGAIGNLYDRLLGQVAIPGAEPIRHQVRDFIDCSELYYPWIFNVADVLLVVGVVVLIVHSFPTRRRTVGTGKEPR